METTSALHDDMKLCMFPAVSPRSGDLEMMVARRDCEILHLREEVRRLQHLLQDVQERTANQITLLQQQLTNKSQDIEILQAKLQSQQDYVKIKAEISSSQWQKQTSVNPNTVLVSSPPPDVSSVSVRQSAALYLQSTSENDPAVKKEMKTPVQSQVELLNKGPVISDLPVINTRSPSLKEETDITHLTSDPCRRAEECFLNPSVSTEALLHITECDENMDVDEPQIDTTRITQQVKEVLQTYKIGQRVFAHYVLGLSQGTVSEILARPKPWTKLTTRGREPFMRMRHFLLDEHSIQTLSLIQHGQRGIIPCSPPPETSSDIVILEQSQLELAEHDRRPPGEGAASENIIRNILQQAKHEMELPSHVMSKMCSNSMVKSKEVDAGRLNPSSLSPTDFVQSIIQKVQSETDGDTHSSINPLDSWCPACSSIDRSSSQGSCQTLPVGSDLSKQEFLNTTAPVQLSKEKVTTEEVLRCGLDQLAVESCRINQWQVQDQDESLISDCPTGYLDIQQPVFHGLELDTLSITKRVKEILTVNNIGQRVFGEAVLGLTQSSVSELLSHPKPWTKLSVKGQENFIHLNLWLQDPHNVQKLKALKTMGQKARLKRSLIGPDIDSQDTTGSEFVHLGLFAPKRQHVVLTSQKKEALKGVYDREPYPSQHTILTLESQLGLQISTVSNWFYNYRSRSRQDTSGGGRVSPHGPVPTIQSPTSFCPVSESSPTRLITIKQEPTDAEMNDAGLQRDEEHNNYVSVGIQSDMRVKQEEAHG